jgi:arabinogalactan endo-1,4-beta-galactosidase
MAKNTNNNREDCIKVLKEDGITWHVPNDPSNRDWQEYQAWLAADPENNIPQEEEGE